MFLNHSSSVQHLVLILEILSLTTTQVVESVINNFSLSRYYVICLYATHSPLTPDISQNFEKKYLTRTYMKILSPNITAEYFHLSWIQTRIG